MMPKLRISWPEKDAVFGNTSLAPTTALGTGDLANQRHNAAQHQHAVLPSHLLASPGRKTTCPSRTLALFPQPGDDRRPTTDDLEVLFFGTAVLSGTATVERRPRAKCIRANWGCARHLPDVDDAMEHNIFEQRRRAERRAPVGRRRCWPCRRRHP
ncbi:tripeptidyl peptidase precursor, partial [Metarhizium hybridum]